MSKGTESGTLTMEVCICHCIACNYGDHDKCFSLPFGGRHRTKTVEAEVRTFLVPKEAKEANQ